jgi:hypothetical protein
MVSAFVALLSEQGFGLQGFCAIVFRGSGWSGGSFSVVKICVFPVVLFGSFLALLFAQGFGLLRVSVCCSFLLSIWCQLVDVVGLMSGLLAFVVLCTGFVPGFSVLYPLEYTYSSSF